MTPFDNADWKEKLLRASGFSAEEVNEASSEEESAKQSSTEKKKKDKLNIFVEKKGRGGKIATIITGFSCSDDELKLIASELKNKLGCGGSCRDGEILIQGNRREDSSSILRQMGFRI